MDNKTCYIQLETATLGKQYALMMVLFKQTRNGSGALLVIKAQFTGGLHWDYKVRMMSNFFINMKLTGTASFILYSFLMKHMTSYNTLQRCVEQVVVELPNERMCVDYLIDNIKYQY